MFPRGLCARRTTRNLSSTRGFSAVIHKTVRAIPAIVDLCTDRTFRTKFSVSTNRRTVSIAERYRWPALSTLSTTAIRPSRTLRCTFSLLAGPVSLLAWPVSLLACQDLSCMQQHASCAATTCWSGRHAKPSRTCRMMIQACNNHIYGPEFVCAIATASRFSMKGGLVHADFGILGGVHRASGECAPRMWEARSYFDQNNLVYRLRAATGARKSSPS